MPKLTPADEKFLRDVGISAEPITSHDEEIFALAERIAKHVAPTAQRNPEIARRESLRLAARDIADLPKRARLDLLTRITLGRLLKEFRASAEDNE